MNQEKIGKFILRLRKENSFTQEEIAEKLNVNVKSVSRWENGKNLPDHSIILEICKIYNISINEFYNGNRIRKSIKIKQLLLFYLIVSFTGVFILPCLGIIAPTFIVCAVLIPVGALIDLMAILFTGHDIPQIIFQLGNIYLHPAVALPISIVVSIIMFVIGMYTWKLLMKYIKFISNKKKKIYIDL